MTQVSMPVLIAQARLGMLVSFPTDTVPALAVRPDQSELIFAAKRRVQEKPLILMGDSLESLLPFVKGTNAELATWQQVAEKYWPGALTLVLPASLQVPAAINPTNPTTIGLRVPASNTALTILSQTGPLATTSANLSGEPALQTMAEIDALFPDVFTLELTAVDTTQLVKRGVPSTVVKWTGSDWEVLRQGELQLDT
ncbi:Sua5/YciO/YrdC/YwlC family protein [Lyngbya aestuarii]|uniref:Sua5/YciO/YrdC/YwlC family protein n=1 Tax=Lyngbya aestuarii TaxID=118322 RepID=UPI00403DDBEA